MGDRQYLVTDAAGIARIGEVEQRIDLGAALSSTLAGDFELVDSTALLDSLDEIIFEAAPVGPTSAVSPGIVHATSIQLLRRTPWDVRSAASFALNCVDHVVGDDRDVTIPGGHTLGSVLADAKRFLASADREEEGRLAKLARLATARRLRRAGASVGDVAMGRLVEDLADEIEATSDPVWTLLASIVDAVLATVEALRHLAFPAYFAEREEAGGERDESVGGRFIPQILTTPWGPFALGAEHESTYTPTSHLAREAAFRARETVFVRAGEPARTKETEWQINQLDVILSQP